MKNINKLILLFCFFFALQSCDSFLEETPYNKVTVGNFYTTKDGIEHGVNGVYSTLRGMYISEWMIYLCEGPSDLWVTWAAPLVFQDWTFDASTGEFYSMWSHCYSSINKINSVVDVLETTAIPDLPQSLADRYIAESKFIRALYYFHLVQQFGDVPLKLKPTKTAETTSHRDSKDLVWKQIIDDLEAGIKILPERYPDAEYGKVTKYAAMHLLSKVYLTLKRNQDDLNKALQYSETIIQSGQYSLVGNHRDLWDINKKRNSEVIFPVLYTKNTELNGNGNTAHMYFVSAYSEEHDGVKRVIEYGRPWSRLKSTYYMLDLYDETKDKRWEDCFVKEWKITETTAKTKLFNPKTKKDEELIWNKGDLAMIATKRVWTKEQVAEKWPVFVFLPDSMRNYIDPAKDIQSATNPNAQWPSNTKFCYYKMYPYIVKHMDPIRPEINTTAGSRDVFVERLGETYLLAAEAAYLLNDKVKAANYINVIRNRAAIPGKEAEMKVDAGAIDIDFILDERGRELAGEMHRWYDLIRTGKMLERLNNPKMYYQNAGKVKDYNVLRPIPRNQLTNMSNPQDFPQNPGYSN